MYAIYNAYLYINLLFTYLRNARFPHTCRPWRRLSCGIRKFRETTWYSAKFRDIPRNSVIFRHIPRNSVIFRRSGFSQRLPITAISEFTATNGVFCLIERIRSLFCIAALQDFSYKTLLVKIFNILLYKTSK